MQMFFGNYSIFHKYVLRLNRNKQNLLLLYVRTAQNWSDIFFKNPDTEIRKTLKWINCKLNNKNRLLK